MVRKLQKGDTTDILTALSTQVMQLQSLGNKIAGTVASSNRYNIMGKFENLHLKTMNETCKTVMAINEICNPKRTTFVKNATQNNHLNSEKKPDIANELSHNTKEEIPELHQLIKEYKILMKNQRELNELISI